jgi:hypothetical protein
VLKVKATVRPRSLVIAAGIINAALELGLYEDMLITSGNDSTHMDGSKHYTDEALDFRTKHLIAADKPRLLAGIRHRLGPNYDVILEDAGGSNEHGHAEYNP